MLILPTVYLIFFLCKGTEMWDAPCLKVQDVWPTLGRGIVAVVDVGSPSRSGAVIRKQLV